MTTVEEARERGRELFCAELNPVLRRLGERPRGAGADASCPPHEAQIRRDIWTALAEVGLLGLAGELSPLVEVAELMGAALFTSPYADSLAAVRLLRHTGLVDAARVATGERRLALAGDATEPLVTDGGTLDGAVRFVRFAPDVDDLVVLGAGATGPVAAVLPVAQPGVVCRRHDDTSRGDFYAVTFDRARLAHPAPVPVPQYPTVLGELRLQHAAYLAGACRGALDLTIARLADRTAFGQPLAKLQAPAYRIAALSCRTAALLSLARAAAADGSDVRLAGAQALALGSVLFREVGAEAVHLHGAYGLTERSDAQVFFRRAAVDTVRLGTVTQLHRLAARLIRGIP